MLGTSSHGTCDWRCANVICVRDQSTETIPDDSAGSPILKGPNRRHSRSTGSQAVPGIDRDGAHPRMGLRNKMIGAFMYAKSCTSTWTHSMRLWSNGMPRNTAANPWLSLGPASGPSCARLPMKRDALACIRPCPLFGPNACVLTQSSCPRTSRAIERPPARCAKSSNASD
jgi:hypothetical protein